MNFCKICGGEKKIVEEICFNCKGSALPIEVEGFDRFLNYREPKPNEYNLFVHYKMTTTDGLKKMVLEDGKINYLKLSDEDMKRYQMEIEKGVVRISEYDILSDSLENAKREAISMAQGFGHIVVKVEERDYCGWGFKEDI
ncbi:MAG: hypothetical protein EKK64_00450 [Neisseriaceae bacterium]|nr:MAG: hypothetical protein EKK64_00450 [Neisseriaceae bacterium]